MKKSATARGQQRAGGWRKWFLLVCFLARRAQPGLVKTCRLPTP